MPQHKYMMHTRMGHGDICTPEFRCAGFPVTNDRPLNISARYRTDKCDKIRREAQKRYHAGRRHDNDTTSTLRKICPDQCKEYGRLECGRSALATTKKQLSCQIQLGTERCVVSHCDVCLWIWRREHLYEGIRRWWYVCNIDSQIPIGLHVYITGYASECTIYLSTCTTYTHFSTTEL